MLKRKKAVGASMGTTMSQRLLYGSGEAGATMIYYFIGNYLSLYYTDSVGISAAFAGTIILVCRIFDGVSDVLAGTLIDRTHSKWGKARPWFALSILPLVIAFIAAFCVPADLGENAKKVYICATYFLLTVVVYTVNNIAYHALLQRFSLTSQDRSAVSGIRSIISVLGGTVTAMLIPPLLAVFGGEKTQTAWTGVVLIFGAIGTVFLLITAFGIKEKLKNDVEKPVNSPKAKMFDGMKHVLSNRYFYIAAVICVLIFTSNNLNSMNYYYARDVIGNTNFVSLSGMVTLLPMLLGVPFVVVLFKKFGKRRIMLGGLAIAAAISLAILINPYSMGLNLVSVLIKQICVLPMLVAMGTLPGDITDYNEMRYGVRCEGLTSCTYTIGGKLGSGFGVAVVLWMLEAGKYNSATTVQVQSALDVMIVATAVVPAIIYIVAFVVLLFWNIEKYQPQVQSFMETKVKTAE